MAQQYPHLPRIDFGHLGQDEGWPLHTAGEVYRFLSATLPTRYEVRWREGEDRIQVRHPNGKDAFHVLAGEAHLPLRTTRVLGIVFGPERLPALAGSENRSAATKSGRSTQNCSAPARPRREY